MDLAAEYEANLDAIYTYLESGQAFAVNFGSVDAKNELGLPLLDQLSARALDSYHQTKQLQKIDAAVNLSRQAFALTPQDHQEWCLRARKFAGALRTRYERTRTAEDLDESVRFLRYAVELISDNTIGGPELLHQLACMLEHLHSSSREVKHLEEAVTIGRRAANALPVSNPRRADILCDLARQMESLTQFTGLSTYLREGVGMLRQALAVLPEDDSLGRANIMQNLSGLLLRIFEREGSCKFAYIDEAISLSQEAIASTVSASGIDLSMMRYNLGVLLSYRYESTSAISDFEESINVTRSALDVMPEDHVDRGRVFANLAVFLRTRWEKKIGGIADLDESISLLRQALAITSDHHPDKPGMFYNLGASLLYRRHATQEYRVGVKEGAEYFLQTWNSVTAPPLLRISTASQCIRHHLAQFELAKAAQVGIDAIELLPTINTKMLNHQDRQYVVSTFATLASMVCSLLVIDSHTAEGTSIFMTEGALKYLEQGRAIILSHLIDGRSDLSILAQDYPDLARQYEVLRAEVNTPLPSGHSQTLTEQQINQRREAVSNLEAHIDHIRSRPGQQRFMMGQTVEEMQGCIREGAAVVINISDMKCDAIIITSEVIRAIALLEVKVKDAKLWLEKEWHCTRSERPAKNREYARYLAWLWTSCVEPVLASIRTMQPTSNNEPMRVWWVGCGLASSMPFHAAGIHQKGSKQTAYDQTISSYAPSIKALAHAQERAKAASNSSGSLLVVTMPTTPAQEGQEPLPHLKGVLDEKSQLLDIAQEHLNATHLDRPSAGEVITALPHSSIAHFACHGASDPIDPSSSALILQRRPDSDAAETSRDSSTNSLAAVQDRLMVQRMLEVDLQEARLAYLSACSTAQNKSEKLADEVIHVASGFQVAGFPHVVGCLWRAKDRICVDVAKEFYTRLLEGVEPGKTWSDERVSSALREAVMKVREDELELPLDWAPYVHYGP